MAFNKKSFTGTQHCGLCRGRFPGGSLRGPDAWQSEFRAILLLDGSEESVEITDVASLPDADHDVDVTLIGRSQLEAITICRNIMPSAERPPDGPAFCFHNWCYSSLIWALKCHPPKLIIYKLVRALIPNPFLWENIREAENHLDPQNSLQTLITHADQSLLGLQPFLMEKLPHEVKGRIWEYVGLSVPYSAFILAAAESSRLARCIQSHPTNDIILEREYHLSAKTIEIFGTDYIQHLGYSEESPDGSRVLGDVTGLQLVLGISGICAIKLLGVDWETDWLGKVPRTGDYWYASIRNPIPYLRCTYNDLVFVDAQSLEPHSTNIALWDQADIPSSLANPDAALFDFERDIIGSSRSPTAVRKRQFFRYLPLRSNAEYIKGLTLYQIADDIVGLEAHYARTSQLLGCRDGCALYFPLRPNEEIAFAWLRVRNSDSPVWAAPSLVIQTTQGRFHTFGSYIHPDSVTQKEYTWVLLRKSKVGSITGLYYENRAPGKIMRLGVVGDGTPLRTLPQRPPYHMNWNPPIGSIRTGLFVSTAVLNDLAKVELCRDSDRCIGMLVHYISGLTLVLGQWRTAGDLHYSCIYNRYNEAESRRMVNICFRITKSGKHAFVSDVFFSDGQSGVPALANSEYHVYRLGECIGWWFSQLYDAVLPWTAWAGVIPRDCNVYQKDVL